MEAVVAQISKRCQEMVEQDDRFGAGKKFVKFAIDPAKSGVDQFASAAIFGNIEFEHETSNSIQNGTTTSVPVVIKTEPPIPKLREFFNSHLQFSNEILFYSQLLPFLNTFLVEDESHFVKFLKGGTSDPVLLSYVIMENASKEGFRLSKSKQLLSLDHILITVNKLGRFHALSYIAKHQNRTQFDSLTAQIKETSWTDTRLETGLGDSDLICAVTRATRKFDNSEAKHIVDGEKYQNKVNKMKEMIFDCPTRFMREITTPKEPMAVLCHGDFCRNNVLFKYSEQTTDVSETSSPIDVLFFDLATIRYSSPVIDLSFFIYLNSNPEIRLHWNQILQSYHDGLRTSVEAFADKNNINVIEGKSNFTSSSDGIFLPSLEDVHQEFVYHAIYGFMLCSFFLPVMMVDNPSEVFSEEGGEFWNVPEEVRHKVQSTMAGEEGTKALNHLVQHLVDMGFV
uniref:CHK kinase-like domain-containing protein n=1 Tax=Cacopsylla melanoneura TaxID=428564 RepID=A0A8D9A5W1_9HEMI